MYFNNLLCKMKSLGNRKSIHYKSTSPKKKLNKCLIVNVAKATVTLSAYASVCSNIFS